MTTDTLAERVAEVMRLDALMTHGEWKPDSGFDDDPKRQGVIVARADCPGHGWHLATIENGAPGDTCKTEKHNASGIAYLRNHAPAIIREQAERIAKLERQLNDVLNPGTDDRQPLLGNVVDQAKAWSAVYKALCDAGMLSFFSPSMTGRGRAVEYIAAMRAKIDELEQAESERDALRLKVEALEAASADLLGCDPVEWGNAARRLRALLTPATPQGGEEAK